ncbi:MAG: site-specific DNA-methyltransferase [Halobacteriaceae archaeon]
MIAETTHRLVAGDARNLALADDSVELAVTSPPYPMIELWDDTFRSLSPAVGDALDAGDGDRAFAAMHAVLDEVWAELARVLAPGGVACVNVGDATRTIETFRRYPNAARVTDALAEYLDPLPDVLWRKPANSAAKFMGSGMLPPNAYVTLEHEYVLVFRNGGTRDADAERRRESAYFFEERNEWFSDVWEVRGERQAMEGARERTAAYPFEVPYRLVNMYSLQGDTVLDPFLGTGTTTLAAMASARNSVGYERDSGLVAGFDPDEALPLARERTRERLDAHRAFAAERDDLGYEARAYGVPVMTAQERGIRLPALDAVEEADSGEGERRFVAAHSTFDG